MAGIGLQMPKEVKIQTCPSISEAEPQAGGREREVGNGKPAQRAPSSFPPSLRPPSSVVGLGGRASYKLLSQTWAKEPEAAPGL